MTAQLRFIRTAIVIAGMLLATLVGAVIQPGTAHARCNGVGVLVNSTLIVNGSVAVTERPSPGTCNGNDFYAARYESNRSGWSATVLIRHEDDPEYMQLPWVTGSNDGLYRINRPGRFRIVLCSTNFSTTHCGWGDERRTTAYPDTNVTLGGWSSGY